MTGCLQDFGQFSPTGSTGGAGTTSSSTSTVTSSNSSSSSSTGAGMCDPPNCDDMDPCTTDTCNGTTCSNVVLMDGTPVPNGNIDMTDCVQPVCMGGSPTNVPLDTEIPSDGEDCTTDVCSGGMIQSTPVMNGTKCGAGMAFDCFGGKCGCNSPADCGMDGECGTRTCTGMPGSKTCGWDYQAPGNSSMQTAGDCRKRVCNGTSEVADVVADNDPTNDNNSCTTEGCDGAMMTTHTPVTPGAPCGSGDECGGGALAGTCCSPATDVCAGKDCGTLVDSCNVSNNCGMCSGGTPVCVTNQCEECGAASDCTTNPAGHACITGNVCGCTLPADCGGATPACDTAVGSAKKNECVQCAANSDCASQAVNKTCDLTPGSPTFDTCVQCTDDAQCTTAGLTQCATVAPGIGTCVECDVNSNNSADCPVANMKKCAAHVCGM